MNFNNGNFKMRYFGNRPLRESDSFMGESLELMAVCGTVQVES